MTRFDAKVLRLEEEDESTWWGSTKKEYYNADAIETEADALEEENEAKRLQQKKLSKMTEEDFLFDANEWQTSAGADNAEDAATTTEVVGTMEIPEGSSAAEKYSILTRRYPEFEHLANELQQLIPVFASLKVKVQHLPKTSVGAVKYWVLGCYVASLAGYLAVLTSPARDSGAKSTVLEPTQLRDHNIMSTLLKCRSEWQRINRFNDPSAGDETSTPADMPLDAVLSSLDAGKQGLEHLLDNPAKMSSLKTAPSKERLRPKKKSRVLDPAKKAALSNVERDILDLNAQLLNAKPTKTTTVQNSDTKSKQPPAPTRSDFGEELSLDARTAADKAQRKKSLKFYTSQIAQKASRRADAGRDAGGDMDIPHRERLRDRRARLIAEAERRGRSDSGKGANLGEGSDEEDDKVAGAMRDEALDYYDQIAGQAKEKKAAKAARQAAYAAANKTDRVVETEEVGEDGKRKITYAIEKNKGLTPRRKKDVRNPRVKKRKQYDAKQKKLASMKPVWRGGEPKGGYQGEVSGINTGVVKSVKL